MVLPNYFLADLPPEATLSAGILGEACQTIRRNRERYLDHRSTSSLIHLLSDLAKDWLAPDFPFRKLALEQGPAATGFSQATLSRGLDAFFHQLTLEAFESLLLQDFGDVRRLDDITSTEAERRGHRAALVTAPGLLADLSETIAGNGAAGNAAPTILPEPTLRNMVLGVLIRSAQVVCCPKGAAFLPRLFAHSLYAAEPKLGACIEIIEWSGIKPELESRLLEEADCVLAAGSEQALAELRLRLPPQTHFLGFRHRVSFAFVAGETLSVRQEREVIAQAGADVVAWNQMGSLAPHAIYVQEGGSLGPEQFAEILARELERREEIEPPGALTSKAQAEVNSRRSIYELRAADSPATRLWRSTAPGGFTVVYEADSRFQLSCLNRFIYVKGVKDLTEALHGADTVRGKVSTVGLAASGTAARGLATQLARWGVMRVCPLGQMQNPPLAWRGDERPTLGHLVRWTDWEQPEP